MTPFGPIRLPVFAVLLLPPGFSAGRTFSLLPSLLMNAAIAQAQMIKKKSDDACEQCMIAGLTSTL